MSSFTQELLYWSIPGQDKKKIAKAYRYFLEDKHIGPFLLIPSGFVFDGASIPRMLWPIFGNPWSGKYDQIAGLHDLGYYRIGWFPIGLDYVENKSIYSLLNYFCTGRFKIKQLVVCNNQNIYVQFTRKALDIMFKEGAQILHTKKYEAVLMYKALRSFGSFAWNKHKKKWKKNSKKPLWVLNNLGRDVFIYKV